MGDDKPLPALPSGSNLVTLSVKARKHRAALIGHFLKGLHEPSIENRRDSWLNAFEHVLDDLGKHMNGEDWLNCIKRGRDFKKSQPAIRESQPLNNAPSDIDIIGFPLQRLRTLVAAPPLTPGQTHLSHLVLCLESPFQSPTETEGHGFNLLPANVGCTFSVDKFELLDSSKEDNVGNILIGLDGLEVDTWGSPLRLVGGTFTLKGVHSALQHQLLFKVLKLAIYVHFSLILEQHILSDSSVQLMPTRPEAQPVPPILQSTTPVEATPSGLRPNYSIIPSSFTNFLSKHNVLRRGSQTAGEVGNRRSLELTLSASHDILRTPHNPSEEGVHEGHLAGRLRRLSLIGEKRLSFLRGSHREPSRERKVSILPQPFAEAFRRIEESRQLLSTSIFVKFPQPKIISDLVEKERAILSKTEALDEKPLQKLQANEKVALANLLGWDGKDAQGKGMSGILGFLRQQELSVLVSHHPVVPPEMDVEQRKPSISSSNSGYSSIQSASTFRSGETSSFIDPSYSQTKFPFCARPSWVTYQYYSFSSGDDFMLGDQLMNIIEQRDKPCSTKPGCRLTQQQHETKIIHDGVMIVINVSDEDENKSTEQNGDREKPWVTPKWDNEIYVWESCGICAARTPQKLMTTGSFLFSYAKYLELLFYSPMVCTLTPALCEHTSPPPTPWTSLPSSRFNIIRHFTTSSVGVSFYLSPIDEVFELEIPRLQIIKGVDIPPSPFAKEPTVSIDLDASNERKSLRKEIRMWWQSVSDHLDKIERVLNADSRPVQKALPRLPSADEAYEIFGVDEISSLNPSSLTPLPPSSKSAPDTPGLRMGPYSASEPALPRVPSKEDSGQLLVLLRQNFLRTERSLYTNLAKSPDTSLNEIRRAFLFAGKGTQKRIKAWQEKHLESAKSKLVGELVTDEPEWWGKGYHVVPSGNTIIRDDDWGSVISHTLSAVDSQLEVTQISSLRSGLHESQAASSSAPSTSSTFFSLKPGYRLFTTSKTQPDPDQEDISWNEMEDYSAVISRKDHARDASGLSSLRDVLGRKATPSQQDVDGHTPSNSSGLSVSTAKANAVMSIVEGVNGGEVTAQNPLQEYDEATPTASGQETPKLETISTSTVDSVDEENISSNFRKNAKGKEPMKSDSPASYIQALPPPLPEKDGIPTGQEISVLSNPDSLSTPLSTSSSTFTVGLTSGLNNAMNYLSNGVESPSRFLMRGLSNAKKPVSRPVNMPDDDRPHIRYEWTMGKRVKFSCTVYYAKQFELLRRKCGVGDSFVTSLSKSANWAAEGGKSKSNFWKTTDDKFIIKTLVNAWNVADLQVLIDHAPFYFRYLDSTASKPTVLAKLMGFYTIEIRNLESGAIQAKADLLVTENLFHGLNISKTFDLKGIQGRKAKSTGGASKTLFDGDWIESQYNAPTLLRPHSKALLLDAIRSDAEFLSKSNIMDYSLLLGIDEKNKEIACGLVDTIGSYTFAKTLEYKAKQGLQVGKEVTVIPPAEYQQRFVKTLDRYFMACPDKWSKPLDNSKVINDPGRLPSVL